ncbi:SpaA isopeptide-forming pilin-related protein [Aporhodopirellula aestuarii]|uniref:SpaA isopeptide-forming pilin-related protein n=1 Tax=Aporhodopirellula aestuarii TaxID=2950107 RepID=A0ABT0U2T4_9BACT|nr:SpaA isopeptide-forming pilin-related protein [Aporhodopirellula aestuarii]MCM2371204.1 SpaA isopeptide-forming pilin-related protein [Aporhodopirellula aestuarii]
MGRSRSYRRRPGYESLESRRLLAAATDLANLSGRVYDDFTGDGYTTGEEVAGASLTLYRDDGDNQFEPGTGDVEVGTATTDADGRYSFERLTAGEYFVLQPAQIASGKTLLRSVSPRLTVTAQQVVGRLITTIDGFDGTFQTVEDETQNDGPVTSTAAASEAIGGSRDLLVEKTSDIGSVSLIVNDPASPNLLQVSSDGFGGGRRVVIWDGSGDDPTVVDDSGLGSIDLTNNGEAAGLRLVIGADLAAGSAVIRLYTNDGVDGSLTQVSAAQLDIPPLTSQPTSVEFLPFTEFSIADGASGPADLTNIGAIEFEVIAGPNYDALADLIGTIGPNVIPVADFDNFESIDLNLSKELITTDANVNGLVSFVLSLTNEGDETATNVVVTDSLPSGISYRSDQPSSGTMFDSESGRWTIPTLASGATATITLTGLLTSSTPQTNTAEVTAADQFDTDSTPNNSLDDEDDQASAVVTASQINLSLDKEVSDLSPNVGDTITFTLTLTNSGINDATNIIVQDTLPSGFSISSSDPDSGSFSVANSQWTVPLLAAGQSTALTLTSTVNTAGTFTNTAEVISVDQFDINSTPGNNVLAEDDQDQVTFQTPVADLSIDKTIVGQVASIGDNVTFSITVNNAGPDPATNVRIREVLPAGLTYVSDTNSLGEYDATTGIWTLPDMPVTTADSTPVTLTLIAAVNTVGTKTNVAEIIASDQTDPDSTPGNGSAGAAGEEDDIDSVLITPVTIDLELDKTVTSSRPVPGETFTYNVTVRNTSNDDATGVIVTDILPDGLIFQSATAGEIYSAGTGIWNVGQIPGGSSRTLAIDVILDPSRTNVLDGISNTAQITAADQFDTDSTPDNNAPNEDDQTSVSITPARADLSITKTAATDKADVGDEITFTIIARNDGPDPSGTFIVSDPIPSGASFSNATAPSGSLYDPTTQEWTISGLAADESMTLTLVLLSVSSGTVNNVAEITSASLHDPDSTPGNGVSSEDDQDDASIQAEQINLSLTKEVDNPTPRAGETFSYTITVTNSGPDAATNIVVGDTLPSSITIVDNDPQTGSFVTSTRRWTIPSLASGVTTTLRLDARIASIANLPAGDPINTGLVNTAEILSVDQVDVNSTPGNNVESEDDQDSVTVRVPIADISVEKNTLTPAPNMGDIARFEVIVRNDGPDPATNLVVRDLLPAGLTYRSDSQSDATSNYVPSTGLWTIPLLGVGSTTRLQINADVTTSGTFTNTAELIASDQDDSDSTPDNAIADEDDQSSDTLSTPVIDLVLTKSSTPNRPSVGSEITFTLQLQNTGPDDASGVQVRDTLPNGFQFLSSSPSAAFENSTGIWNVETLAAGASTQLEIRGTVESSEAFTNLAEVIAADQFDRDSTPDNGFDNNEDDFASVTITPANADLSLTKTVNDSTPNVGEDVIFTLTIRNDGNDSAANIEVLDSLPSGLTNIRSSTATGEFTNSDSIWRIPELAAGSTASLTLTATVDFDSNNSTQPITRTNYAEIIASSQFDPDSTPNNNSDDEDDDDSVEFTPQLIDLALSKAVDNDRPNVGETVEYLVTVSNEGPSDATNVVVEDQLPADLAFVSASPSTGGSYSSQTGRWTIPLIPAGETRELTIRASVSPNISNLDAILTEGIVNIAQVIAADQPDRDSTPNNGEGEDDYQSIALTLARANLSLDKVVDIANPNRGDLVTFTVTVSNAGPDTATNIVVQDTIPTGLADVQITSPLGQFNPSTGRWTIDQLGVGENAVLQIQARVSTSDILTNTAEIIAVDQLDPNSTPANGNPAEDDIGSVVVSPKVVDISVSATVTPNQATVGDIIELTVVATNGQIASVLSAVSTSPLAATADRTISDATGVVVEISIPDGLTLLSEDPAGVYDQQTRQWQIGNLAAGASTQLILRFRVDAQSLKTFNVEVVETNEFDIDSTAGNNIPSEDDQSSATVTPPRTLSKRLFLAR